MKNVVVPECGIIMPISPFGEYTAEFWFQVRDILDASIKQADMCPHPVWEDETTDIIPARIVKNINELPIMVAVIIGNNPNVMIECGMRLWSNLPLLLIYEEGCKIPFDVGSISCLCFPKLLNDANTVRMKDEISRALKRLSHKEFRSFRSYYLPDTSKGISQTIEKKDNGWQQPLDEFATFAQAALDEWLMYALVKMRWGDESRISYYKQSKDATGFVLRARSSPVKEYGKRGVSGTQNNRHSLVAKAWNCNGGPNKNKVFVFTVPSSIKTKDDYTQYVMRKLCMPREDAQALSMMSHIIMACCIYENTYKTGVLVIERIDPMEGVRDQERSKKQFRRLIREVSPHFMTLIHKEEGL